MPRTFEEDQLATVSQLLDQLDHTASAARRLDLSVQIRKEMRNFLQSTKGATAPRRPQPKPSALLQYLSQPSQLDELLEKLNDAQAKNEWAKSQATPGPATLPRT